MSKTFKELTDKMSTEAKVISNRKTEEMLEKMNDAVLKYITNQINAQAEYPDKWILFNGVAVKIVDTMWDLSILLYPDYKCQGTVSEALYHIEQGTLMYFLTASS